MPGAIEQMRPSLRKRLFSSERKQVILAWATPIIFVVIGLTCVLINDPHMRKQTTDASKIATPEPVLPVKWNSLPWKELPRITGREYKPITIHGKVTGKAAELYTKEPQDFVPKKVTLENVLFSPTGHIVYKKQPYPENNPMFEEFDRSLLAAADEENISFEKLVPVQVPPKMSALDGLLHILPLAFCLPQETYNTHKVAVPREFASFGQLFNSEGYKMLQPTRLHSIWGAASQAEVIEIPNSDTYPLSCLHEMRKYKAQQTKTNNQHSGNVVILPGDYKKVISKIMAAKFPGNVMDEQWCGSVNYIIAELTSKRGVVSAMNPNLEAVALADPGTLVIEIQTPDYISKGAILASAMGLDVHVFVVEEGQELDIKQIVDLATSVK